MNRIPLLSGRSRSQQLIAVVVSPAVFGAVAGLVLGASAPVYWVLQALAAVGGLLAGMEHVSARQGAARGALGGAVYGAFILIAHEISGAEAEADIGDPEILLIVVTAVFGSLLGAAGAAFRRRAKPA